MENQDLDTLRAAVEAATTESGRLAAMLALAALLGESDPPQALLLANESLGIAERLNDARSMAHALRRVAVLRTQFGGDVHDVLEQLEHARTLYESVEDLKGVADTSDDIGVVYSRRFGNNSAALRHHEIALSLYDKIGDSASVAHAMGNIGLSYHGLGEYARALQEFEQARAIYEELGDRKGVAARTLNIGDSYKRLGDNAKALEQCQLAVAQFDEIGYRKGVANATWSVGNVHWRLGDYARALEDFVSASMIYEELGDDTGVADVATSLANVYTFLGDYLLALEHYQQAITLFEKVGSHRIATATGNLGAVYSRLGEYAKALEQFQAALNLTEEAEDPGFFALLTLNIGATYGQLGDHAKALEQSLLSLSMFEAIGDRNGVAEATSNIGAIYVELGEFEKALSQFRSALALYEELGDRAGIANSIGDIGSVFGRKEFDGYDAAVAVDHLQRAIGIMEEVGGKDILCDLHLNLAELYRAEGNWMESHKHLTTSHQFKDELQSIAAHKKVEQLAHLKRIAEMEKLRAVERAQEEAARETLAVRAELLEAHLERQRSELAAQAINLARQCELLGDFRNDLRAIMRDGSDPLTIVKRFADKLRQIPVETIDWSKFDAEFRATYPDFQSNLVQRYPELTGMEIKVCALLKLRLTSPDIAKILCITERSVEGHRYHIRKRMGLEKGTDIMDVLSAM